MVNLRVFRNFLQKAILRGRLNPLEFMDEYASVMNRYVKIEVRNRFKEGGVDLSLNFGSGDGWLLWLEDGQYCFDAKERGKS